MELLMLVGLIGAVAWLMRKVDVSAKERVRGMEDEDLAEAAAEAMSFNERESIYYDEIARRQAIRARLAQ